MSQAIEKEFNFVSLLKFSVPTIIMMIFTAMYTIVDGVFVSRFVGSSALSAINIVFPLISVVFAVSIMLATGGSAIVARRMGQGKNNIARENFSFIVLCGVISGVAISILGIMFIDPIIRLLGANEALMDYCRNYLSILLIFAPACVLQMLFQTFFVTAGKPTLGLALTVLAGITNVILDYIFIVPLDLGISGAALATSAGYMIPAVSGLIYFAKNKGELRFAKPKVDWKVLKESCFNGSSEMVTNLSSSIVTFLFNIIMMKYLGENGVAAITIVLYAQFLLVALYLGFSIGVAPVISFNYGSKNLVQLKKIFKICITFILGSSLIVFVTAIIFASPVVGIFSPKDSEVYSIAFRGFILFSGCYLFAGINIFASSMFTALSDGKTSAIISFMRTFVFIILGMMLLPKVLDVDGIWLAIPFAECATMFLSVFYLRKKRKIYKYI